MAAYILNLFDLACTLYALHLGVKEANPFMRCIPVQIVYKVFVVGGFLWWLSTRPERLAAWGLGLCTLAYAALAVHHCLGLYKIHAQKEKTRNEKGASHD